MRVGSAAGDRLTGLMGVAIALVGVVAVLVFALNVVRVAASVDERVLGREAAALKQGVRLMGEFAASDLISFTHWDEAVSEVTSNRSIEWMQENLGRDVFSEPREQRMAVLDWEGKVLFSSEVNGRPRDEIGEALSTAVGPLLARIKIIYRELVDNGDDFFKRHGDGMVEGVYAHELATIAGRPALVTASPVVPDYGDVETPDTPDIMLDIRFFTPTMLDQLGQLAHLDRVHLADTGSAEGIGGQVLYDAGGETVAVLAWHHNAPGTAVLQSMRPVLMLSAGVVALLALGVAAVIRSKTRALARSEAAAIHAARHDGATGLANRSWFLEEFGRIHAARRGAQGVAAVLLIDCDRFKSINDTLGHDAGDAVLLAIANRLRAMGPKLAIAARFGGDEFAAILEPVGSVDEAANLVDVVCETLMQPVFFSGRAIQIGVSVGAALFDRDGAGCDHLLKRADLALYRAKRDGRGCWRIFDPTIDAGYEATGNIAPARERRTAQGGRAV